MRVKRLEIQGFKSFKDKTVIHFDHSITGIVGPNGCGKSNIVDAFFWVMGEQSYKHIRGSGSDDLIFNGSSKYAPLGLAEATLVLESDVVDTSVAPSGASADGEETKGPVIGKRELSVTRRLYRGGEGEYFINGVQARLKDIHELFLDTGVGTKGYSVIEQGQIGKIVNAKPEDRRQLIEEAAGIAKYKARKKESLRKIEATEANLSRLTDIVQEIERNRDQLERQAQKAIKYKEYKKELLDKEMVWGRRKHRLLNHKLQALKTERDRLEAETASLRAQLQTLENESQALNVAQLTHQKDAEQLQQQYADVSKHLTQDQSALELSRQRQEDLAQQIDSLERERTGVSESLAQSRQTAQEQQASVEKLSADHAGLAEDVGRWTEKLREAQKLALDARTHLDSVKREWLDGMGKVSQYQSQLAGLRVRMDSGRDQLERYAQERAALAEREQRVAQEGAHLETALASARSTQESLGKEAELLESEFDQTEALCAQLQREHQLQTRETVQVESRLESLKAIAASREGLGSGTKAALDWTESQGRRGVFELLADMYEVDENFDRILEAWLEDRLETIVARNGLDGMDALNLLRSEQQGRATIQFGFVAEGYVGKRQTLSSERVIEVLRTAGFSVLGELRHFVRVSQRVEWVQSSAIANQLLEGAVVVENLEPLRQAPSMLELVQSLGGWTVLGRDGLVLTGEAVLRGGSTEAQSVATLLGQRRAIQHLESEVAGAREKAQRIENTWSEAKAKFETQRVRLKEIQVALQAAHLDVATQTRALQQWERARTEVTQHLSRLEISISEIKKTMEQAEHESVRLQEAQGALEARHRELEAHVASQDQLAVERDRELKDIDAQFQAVRIREASETERWSAAKRELENTLSLLRDREKRLADLNSWYERVVQEKLERTGSDSGLQERIGQRHQESSRLAEQLASARNQLEQIQGQLQSHSARIKELYHQIDVGSQGAQSTLLEIEKISAEHAFLVQNLEEKYGKGCLDAEPSSPEQEPLPDPIVTQEMSEDEERQLNEEVERLRERIRRLGDVNPMALEEFEEIKKRHETLLGEREDLITSIRHLNEAIDHINRTSEDRFRQAFDAIKNRFERLFPIIFGGGHAELSLIAPENPTGEDVDILDSGVEILAQPPGKKVVNIGLLSGGEKALTAVCLIFAIFMVKPSPFCILDEVDAPLDDANIGKFNALLKEMSSKTQFILITHNKKTMELNDTLYGVTMEEPGVSKMISIEMS